MKTKMTQAWGWLVAGVLAAGLNASYHDGGLQWVHQVAEQISDRFSEAEYHSSAVLEMASGRAGHFVSEARTLTASNEAASCPWATAMARVRTRVARSQYVFDRAGFDRLEAGADRQKAQLARFEADRARVEVQMARIGSQIEAQTAHLRISTARITTETFAPVDFKLVTAPVVCSRIRVRVPRLPKIRIPAPAIDIETGTGPI
jgi:hypothetical protein